MDKNRFFNPSPLYKEFLVLDLIDKHESITQRSMSSFVGASISMINAYLASYEEAGTIVRQYVSPKIVNYRLTDQGVDRLKLLNVWLLSDAQKIYEIAKENIKSFLMDFIHLNHANVYLYGAGDMGELFLSVIQEGFHELHIQGFIDDDIGKQNHAFLNHPVSSLEDAKLDNDTLIIISSYNHHHAIKNKLINFGIDRKQIKGFFDEKN